MVYFAGIVITLFLLLLVMTKKNRNRLDLILGIWIFIAFLNLSTYYLKINALYEDYPRFIIASLTFPILHPTLLLICLSESVNKKISKFKLILYFIPFIISNLIFLPAYFISQSEAVQLLKNEGKGYEFYSGFNYLVILLTGCFFLVKCVLLIFSTKRQFKDNFKGSKQSTIIWLQGLLLWITGIWLLVLFRIDEKYIYISFVGFVIWLGYSGIKKFMIINYIPVEEEVENNPKLKFLIDSKQKKYRNSSLTENQVHQIHQDLKSILLEQKVFKNSDLSLEALSNLIHIHPNYVSEVINKMENKNFSELINELRVEEFIKEANHPKNQRFTYVSIAYDCGFNSKASFHRNFKKLKGLTPKEYMMRQQDSL